jgi:hypothetical protein
MQIDTLAHRSCPDQAICSELRTGCLQRKYLVASHVWVAEVGV